MLQLPKPSVAQSVCVCAAYGFQRHSKQIYGEGENSLCRSHLRLMIHIRMWIQLLLLKFRATVIFSKRSNSPSKGTSIVLRKKCWNSTITKNCHELLSRDLCLLLQLLYFYMLQLLRTGFAEVSTIPSMCEAAKISHNWTMSLTRHYNSIQVNGCQRQPSPHLWRPWNQSG